MSGKDEIKQSLDALIYNVNMNRTYMERRFDKIDEKLMTIKQQIKGEEPMCDKNAREKYQKDASVECEAKCSDENENRSPLVKIDETILQFTFLYNSIWEIKNHLNDIEDSMAKIKSALLDAMQKNMKDQMPPINFPPHQNFYDDWTKHYAPGESNPTMRK